MAEITSESSSGEAGLQLPAQVTLARTSLCGPFGRGSLDAGHAKVAVVNGAAATATITRVFLAPLADARTGLAPRTAHTTLSAEVNNSPVDPGEATAIEITGTVPAHPGFEPTQSRMGRLPLD